MTDHRELQLQAWCEAVTGYRQQHLQPVSGDASFRRYFRCSDGHRSYIAVDAPPPQESLQPFMAVAAAYAEQELPVPTVVAADEKHGFMLLTDLGNALLLGELTSSSMESFYRQALTDLMKVMRVTETSLGPLPTFDRALLERELALFHDWLVHTHLGLQMTRQQQTIWVDFCAVMVANALAQPQVGVHRDFHSRNIMVQPDNLAYIDFQDAVVGPITYDAVSLLRDCYTAWPAADVHRLSQEFLHQLQIHQFVADSVTAEQWQRWFDLMGMQRHTKAAGIFARLYHRDGKSGYLRDIPRTVDYLVHVSAHYQEFADYRNWLITDVVPALQEQA